LVTQKGTFVNTPFRTVFAQKVDTLNAQRNSVIQNIAGTTVKLSALTDDPWQTKAD